MLKNLLTLRYDSSLNSQLPKLDWRSFIPNESENSEQIIEEKIINYLKKIPNLDDSSNIAAALSGGIDSTLVLYYIKKQFPENDIKTFSVKFSNSVDETPYASKISENLDVDFETIFVDNYFEELPKAISLIKLPFWDIHWYYVAKNASKFSNFLVSGDGGDELFGGYTFRYQKFLSLIENASDSLEKTRNYLKCHARDHVGDQESIFNKNLEFSWDSIYSQIIPFFENSLEPLNQVFYADYSGKLLHNFSIINPLINKHFQLQSITPLLSPEMISFATHVPSKLKFNQESNQGKLLLQNLLKKNKLDSLIIPSKQGFSVNTKSLWNAQGKKLCKDYLLEANIVRDGYINESWIKKHIENELDINYINKFYGILAFEIWYRLFITKEISSNSKL